MGSGELILLLIGILVVVAILWFVLKTMKVLTKIDQRLSDSTSSTQTGL